MLQVATLFDEKAQDEIFGADGDFRAASTVVPVEVAQPDGDGHVTLHPLAVGGGPKPIPGANSWGAEE